MNTAVTQTEINYNEATTSLCEWEGFRLQGKTRK